MTHCPRLDELPSPPAGKTGWPWTEESPQHSNTAPGIEPWPRISIVTPSYNQGKFIEETIRSVLLQGYPNLEYFVIDGGSTDNSIEIIRKYEKWLTYWVSEPDRGQAHAVNKGLERATSEIAAYLNSDDVYLRGCLSHVGGAYLKTRFDVLVGRRWLPRKSLFLLRKGWWETQMKSFVYPFIFTNAGPYELPQECIFWSHKQFGKARFNEDYHCCLDVWWFSHIYSGALVVHTTKQLGFFRDYPENKSNRLKERVRKEAQMLKLEMKPFEARMTDEAKKEILSSFYRASFKTLFQRLLILHNEFFFQYQHPKYLD